MGGGVAARRETALWLHDRTLRRVRAAVPGLGRGGVHALLLGLTAWSGHSADGPLLDRIATEPAAAYCWLPGRRLLLLAPAARGRGLAARYDLAPGHDLTVVTTAGFLPRAEDGYVRTALVPT